MAGKAGSRPTQVRQVCELSASRAFAQARSNAGSANPARLVPIQKFRSLGMLSDAYRAHPGKPACQETKARSNWRPNKNPSGPGAYSCSTGMLCQLTLMPHCPSRVTMAWATSRANADCPVSSVRSNLVPSSTLATPKATRKPPSPSAGSAQPTSVNNAWGSPAKVGSPSASRLVPLGR